MAPDIEELIYRVNTLTVDKNKLKQKLNQLTFARSRELEKHSGSSSHSPPNSSLPSISSNSLGSFENNTNNNINVPDTRPEDNSKTIAGIECATSCESDILYANELLKKRLDEYKDNWDYLQSKCTALLSELNALQKRYATLKREKLDLEEQYRNKCEEHDLTKSELQTVALNYETQLGAMSEHLSMITNQVAMADGLE